MPLGVPRGRHAGVIIITAVMGLPFIYTARRAPVNRSLGVASGRLRLGFGLMLAYQIGVVDGLFRAPPIGSPSQPRRRGR